MTKSHHFLCLSQLVGSIAFQLNYPCLHTCLHYISRFTSQLPSSSIIQNKWTANWITIYKSYYKSRTKVQTNGVRHFATKISETRTNDQQNLHDKHGSHNKGKSSKIRKFRKTWSWKAGAGWTILSVLDWWLIAAGGWLTWRGLLLKWTPLGIGLAAAIHWHLRNQDCDRKGLPRTASRWMVSLDILFIRNFFVILPIV